VRARQLWILLAAALGVLLCGPARVSAEATEFQLIASPDITLSGIDRRFLAEAFLKKTTRWPNDQLIRPVDLEPRSPVRRDFSDRVLKRSVAAVKSYWQQMVFSGRGVPPPELDTEAQVVSFVLRNPGSVGYVSVGTSLHGARTLAVW
jgi:ABC-type phosphate transport system substrate-binding protein